MDHTLLITLVIKLLNHIYLHQILGFSKQHESKHSVEMMSHDLVSQHTVSFKRNFIPTLSGNVPSSAVCLPAAAWSLFGILVAAQEVHTQNILPI